jgi:rare lipoprotein A
LLTELFLEGDVRRIVIIGYASILFAGFSAGDAAWAARNSLPHKQVGKASVYPSHLQGRPMTNGERFNAGSSAAASKTLPIGTKARVTNLETGKSAEVTIKDRGPVPKGRVVDLTPHTAQQIGLTKKEGVAPVAVVPTSLPKATETAASVRSRR